MYCPTVLPVTALGTLLLLDFGLWYLSPPILFPSLQWSLMMLPASSEMTQGMDMAAAYCRLSPTWSSYTVSRVCSEGSSRWNYTRPCSVCSPLVKMIHSSSATSLCCACR